MKAECQAIASLLLSIDNYFAAGVTNLECEAPARAVLSAIHAEAIIAAAEKRGELSKSEVDSLLNPDHEPEHPGGRLAIMETVQNYLREKNLGAATEFLQEMHERAEGLLLEKVIACECRKGD